MIIKKSPAEIEAMKEAGRVSAKVLREVGRACGPACPRSSWTSWPRRSIRAEGGIPAFKGYGGFPAPSALP